MNNIPRLFSQKQMRLSVYGELTNILNKDELTNKPNNLIILTAFGIISGTYQIYKDSKEVENSKDVLDIVNRSYNNLLKDTYEKEPEVKTNFCRSIVLKDVTITTSSNNKINMPFIELFDDQIIGVTLGSFDN